MEFECVNQECKEIFIPHPHIGFRHPSNAKCPTCGDKGKLTEKGREMRKSRFAAQNKSNYSQ